MSEVAPALGGVVEGRLVLQVLDRARDPVHRSALRDAHTRAYPRSQLYVSAHRDASQKR